MGWKLSPLTLLLAACAAQAGPSAEDSPHDDHSALKGGSSSRAAGHFADLDEMPWAAEAIELLATHSLYKETSATGRAEDEGKPIREDNGYLLLDGRHTDVEPLLAGTGEGKFEPGKGLTRRELAALIVRLRPNLHRRADGRARGRTLGDSCDTPASRRAYLASRYDDSASFEEGTDEGWGNEAICLTTKAGILVGSGGRYRPNDRLTYSELLAALRRTFVWEPETSFAPDCQPTDGAAPPEACEAARRLADTWTHFPEVHWDVHLVDYALRHGLIALDVAKNDTDLSEYHVKRGEAAATIYLTLILHGFSLDGDGLDVSRALDEHRFGPTTYAR